jgi:hypothetical protein
MAVNYVKFVNYKLFENLELRLDGKNTFFVGDIGKGKSTVLDAIMMANMQKEWTVNPLTEGKEKGSVQFEETLNGDEYVITRSYTKSDKGRWVVTYKNPTKDKKPPSLSDLLESILKKALKNSFFDYTTYFFELKSPQARFDYMANTCGGDEVTKNNLTKKQKIISRREIGKNRAQQLAVYKQLGELTKEEVQSKSTLYAKAKEQEEADLVYHKILEEQISVEPINIELNNLKELCVSKKNILDSISNNLSEIEKLRAQIIELEDKNTTLQIAADKIIIPENKKEELILKRDKVLEDNLSIQNKADAAFTEEVNKIIQFNAERKDFIDSVTALREYKKLDQEWETIDAEITNLEIENTELFKQKLPIPELGVSTKETDKEIIDIVTYKGREFSFENLSKGESIIIAAQIQNALNPGGNNFIVIPEANLLGSKLDDILAECKKFDIQALVEVTQRKQEFKIVFEEEFLKS